MNPSRHERAFIEEHEPGSFVSNASPECHYIFLDDDSGLRRKVARKLLARVEIASGRRGSHLRQSGTRLTVQSAAVRPFELLIASAPRTFSRTAPPHGRERFSTPAQTREPATTANAERTPIQPSLSARTWALATASTRSCSDSPRGGAGGSLHVHDARPWRAVSGGPP